MEYYSAVKKNEILSFATTCMELEVIMPLPLNVKGNWTSSVSSLQTFPCSWGLSSLKFPKMKTSTLKRPEWTRDVFLFLTVIKEDCS
ncbi:uncharacterized protein LOC107966870 isoform X2 [Pan troglodytes]|uniref:uncharacterized protein LOC107966870 isoform X2 n=1 Tax=Pan troglodytes TaxID=9598 RepID=UPI0030137E21